MPGSIHPETRIRARRVRRLVLATLVTALALAGCGGSSSSTSTSTLAGASTAASSAGPASSSASSTTTKARSTASGGGASGPLAFSECMRTNGVPNFPDPQPGGNFALNGSVNPASPAFRAAQSKCQKLLGGGAVGGPLIPGAQTHPSPQTLAKLVRIAQCMREHGIKDFPDPRTSIPTNLAALGIREVTNFDGVILLFPDTMNLQAPAYRQALTACGAPPLGLPH